MNKIRLALKNANCDIVIGEKILSKLGSYLEKLNLPQRVVVISDSTVGRIYGSVMKHALSASGFKADIIILPPGEKVKSLDFARKIYKKLLEMRVHRDSTIVALGGGVIGDFTGFVAATYMRGVNFVQVPTTLLAAVDASIGGKTAVNLEEAKNIVGVFYQPKLVFFDVATLITLPPKEIRNGLAEVIKYGVIKDASLFSYLERQIGELRAPKLALPGDFKKLLAVWEKIVKRSAYIKARVVESDEKELKGPRMILNLGHTIGHAIEAIVEYKGMSHGEAVALGMIAATLISVKLKIASISSAQRIRNLISAVNLPTTIKDIEAEDIIAKLILDKKVRDGKVLFVLPKNIGAVVIKNDVPIKIVREALKEIGAK